MPPASARQIPPLAPAETGHPPDTTATILTGQRVMQTFDFEERNTNYLDLPMYWHKVVGRDGFPHYSTAVIDSTHHRSGRYSFKLIPDGGSVAYEYDPRRIPVKAGSDFQVTGYVHLENVHTCRARITCALTDRRGVPIPGSEHASQLVGPDQQGLDGWVRNRSDGTVEAVFSGSSDGVNEMIVACRSGPPAAKVTGIECLDDADPPGHSGFHQRPTL